MARRVVFVLVALLLSGCLGSAGASSATIRWTTSVKNCSTQTQNDVTRTSCTYHENGAALLGSVRCGTKAEATWEVKQWIHGHVRVVVTDGAGQQVFETTFTKDGTSNETFEGAKGMWRIDGETADANGQFRFTLACA